MSQQQQRRFILEKRPNLLSATLLLPLAEENATEEAAALLGKQLGIAHKTGPFRQPISFLPKHIPCMKVETNGELKTSTISIFAPFIEQGKSEEYVKVEMDCKIDVERSILTLQGDHLACRLAFTEYSSARDCKEERESRHPAQAELEGSAYFENGIQCRNCQTELVQRHVLQRASRAPRLPWAELVECMTCVNLEEYVAEASLGQYAAAGSQKRVTPEAHSVIVSESHLCLFGADCTSKALLDLEDYLSPPLLLNESEENAKSRRWQVAKCAKCKCWLGDARLGEDGTGMEELRVFKFAVQTANLFTTYSQESVLCGAAVDAAFSRECYRFVLAFGNTPVLRLVLLSYDSWISTHLNPTLTPCVKFLYWLDLESDRDWAARTGAEWIGLPDKAACEAIKQKLVRSTEWLPHSMRTLPDKSRVGFLYW